MIIIKKIKIISVFIIMCLSFLSHFMYEWYDNFLFSMFFPVNESIWEHTKIIPTSTLIYTLFYLIKNKNLNNNFLLGNTIASILSIFLLIIIYTPLYIIFKENFIIAISVMLIVIIISQKISYFIIKKDKIKYSNFISFIIIVLMYIIFGILSYKPLKTMIFYDPLNELYGINTYILMG